MLTKTDAEAVKARFTALYERSASRLLAWITRRLQDPEAATELWAECWAIAFERWPSCRAANDDAGAERWLFGIAQKRIAIYYRSAAIERRALERLRWSVPTLQESEADALAQSAGLETLRSLLADALSALPEKRRRAIQLRVVSGLPYREVAARLGCSEQAARAHVSRGLGRLARVVPQIEARELAGGS